MHFVVPDLSRDSMCAVDHLDCEKKWKKRRRGFRLARTFREECSSKLEECENPEIQPPRYPLTFRMLLSLLTKIMGRLSSIAVASCLSPALLRGVFSSKQPISVSVYSLLTAFLKVANSRMKGFVIIVG